jgi:hypothetical protein
MATIGCGISHKDTKHTEQINAATTKQIQRNKMKLYTNTSSKYCKDKTKNF